jgi:transcriptional regulator with XRE-family HTH domain
MKVRIEATLRGLRRRKKLSQRQLAQKLGCSQQTLSRLEADVRRAPIGFLESWGAALGAYVSIELRVSGERAQFDKDHAALQNATAATLRRFGWLVESEVSFNHFGDRGRIDILAFHPVTRVLLVIEIKTMILDVQDVLGRLDVKTRIAPMLARERGWRVAATVPGLIIREGRTARRRVADHPALFSRFGLRARAAGAWIRHPLLPPPAGLLIFEHAQGG